MLSTLNRYQTPLLLTALVIVTGLLGVMGGAVLLRVAILGLISVVFVCGLSIFTSNSGIMSFGHVVFMAIGAYTAAYLTMPVPLKSTMFSNLPEPLVFLREIESGFVAAVLIGGLLAVALAVVVAPAMARLSGLQAGIATLALLMVLYTVFSNWTDVTRGNSSIIGIPQQTTVWHAIGFAVLAIVIAYAYQRSRSGLQLRASREDYWAAEAAGIAVSRHRAVAWILSAFSCGMAGALYASFLTTFNVDGFFLSMMFGFIVMIVVGGYLSLSGAVVGAILISVVQELLRRLQDGAFTGGEALPGGIADVCLAILMLVVLIKMRSGIMGSRELSLTPLIRRIAKKSGARISPHS